MPTYEYRCKSCGYEFEEFQSMSAEKLVICPKCAEPSLRRLMSSGVGLLFKGSGFYLTDYKKSNSSTFSQSHKSEAESKAESESERKSESKTESKSETKTESKSESKPSSKTETKTQSKTESKSSKDSSSGMDKK